MYQENVIVDQFDKTDAGSIAANGYISISFLNTGTTNVTVKDRVYPPGFGECWGPIINKTYGEIPYDANGGTIWFTCFKS